MINLTNIIEEKNVISLFQPIISLRDKRVIGFEALSRGICSETGRIIGPLELFSQAKAEGKTTELDRLCRLTALKSFKSIPEHNRFMLFINLDTSVIDQGDDITKRITKEYTDEVGLDYSSISIEIVESKIENNDRLSEFVEHYRNLGYYVSLDDFGAMHSNMNRIAISKPDIIKVDMELIRDVSVNYYQQSILGSIIDLAKKTGALTLAEGLENQNDIIKCYELGIDLYQGYYFYKPCVDVYSNFPFIMTKIDYLVHSIKNKLKENVLIRKNQHSGFDFIVDFLKGEAAGKSLEDYRKFLKAQSKNYDVIEKVFILDENGYQVCESYSNVPLDAIKAKSFAMLHEENSDHSLRDYYYYLDKIDSDRFFTDTFMSTVSGRILRTMSCKVELEGKIYVLCVDFIDNVFGEMKKFRIGA